MNNNQSLEFWNSKRVKRLLSSAVKTGVVTVLTGVVKFNFTDMHYMFASREEGKIYAWYGVAQFAKFAEDVVNDKFDLTTLQLDALKVLKRYFGEVKYNSSFMYSADQYCDQSTTNTYTILTATSKYFSFLRTNIYYLCEATEDEAYNLLAFNIKIAKKYKKLEDIYETFVAKVNSAYNDVVLMKQVAE